MCDVGEAQGRPIGSLTPSANGTAGSRPCWWSVADAPGKRRDLSGGAVPASQPTAQREEGGDQFRRPESLLLPAKHAAQAHTSPYQSCTTRTHGNLRSSTQGRRSNERHFPTPPVVVGLAS